MQLLRLVLLLVLRLVLLHLDKVHVRSHTPSTNYGCSLPCPFLAPGCTVQMLLLLQMDISERAEKETRLNAVTETQLNMLEQM